MHPSRLPIEQLLAGCSIRTTRRSGPGGQHRNKVETAVIIEHQPSGLAAEANEQRSQAANRDTALFRLRLKLAVKIDELDCLGQPATSALWQERSQGGKLNVSPEHDDFPALLAELMECLHQYDYSLRDTASEKRVSASQLVNLLKSHPPALAAVNKMRQKLSLRKLK